MGTGRRQVQAYRCGKGRSIHRSHSPCGAVQRSDRRAKGQEQQPESHRSQRQQGRAAAAELVPVCTGTGSAQVHERIGQGKSGDLAANHRRGRAADTDRIRGKPAVQPAYRHRQNRRPEAEVRIRTAVLGERAEHAGFRIGTDRTAAGDSGTQRREPAETGKRCPVCTGTHRRTGCL